MGTYPKDSTPPPHRILFIDARASGLASLNRIDGDEYCYAFTHVAALPEALIQLAQKPFDAILWSYHQKRSERVVRDLFDLAADDLYASAHLPPLICVFEADDHGGVAHAMTHASTGCIFVSQLKSAQAHTILGAVIRRVSHEQLLEGAQQQLVNTEKFAAMGHLAAEVAHEINNPASFVISNLSVMTGYINSISEFLDLTQAGVRDEAPELDKKLSQLSAQYEIAFLQEDLDELLRRSLHGMQRIHQIVQDLRLFLHDAHGEIGWVNVERLLETTLSLVKYEARLRTRIELDFCDDAEILSDANRLSQVFLNLLVNAIHSIVPGDVEGNQITVSTQREPNRLKVIIRDSGSGMSARVMRQIFEPFYTTKDRGDGSGLGLSISRDIVQGLGGQVSVQSVVDKGSAFTVELPIRAPKSARELQSRDAQPPAGDEPAGAATDNASDRNNGIDTPEKP